MSAVLMGGLLGFAVGPSRTKVVTPNSSLKFTPEELVLYCRDLRVVCFLFDRLTPDAQVVEVSSRKVRFARSGTFFSPPRGSSDIGALAEALE